jgi:periplasmic copper chaperone A
MHRAGPSPLFILALLVLAGCSAASTPSATVADARVRLPAAPGLPAAGYFRADLTGGEDAVRGAASPAAARIELHTTRAEGGMSRMRAASEVAGTGRIVFEPGGNHLMIFGLRGDLRPGGAIPITITFRNAPAVTVEARLEPPGGADHGGH